MCCRRWAGAFTNDFGAGCLGVRTMACPGSADIGTWRITIDAAHSASASGPLGTYRIAADGHESWSRTP